MFCFHQVWFQNRRARHFKSKKLSREASRLQDLQPDPGLQSPPGHPAPGLPQSSRFTTVLNPPDSSTSGYPRGPYQDHCSDFFDSRENVHARSGLDDCSDLEVFFGDARGSQLETLQQDLEDLSDLDLQDLLGDFTPSDLDISVATMIDDLFELNH